MFVAIAVAIFKDTVVEYVSACPPNLDAVPIRRRAGHPCEYYRFFGRAINNQNALRFLQEYSITGSKINT
jgi:hypothetical protein